MILMLYLSLWEASGVWMCDGVLFVERAGELPSLVRLSHIVGGAEAKASPKGHIYASCIEYWRG